jgi:FixJ family two-component response regulator
MNPSDATVFVIDDDKGVRSGIKNLLESMGHRVEAYAATKDFLKAGVTNAPACLVLDVRLPGTNGLDFQRELQAAKIEIPVVFITGHGDIPMTVQAMKAGAVDFLPKPFREQDLLDAVQRALDRDRARNAQQQEGREIENLYKTLTPREREVMSFVVGGLLNKQIAGQMGTSETTAKIHRGQVMRKMHAQSLPDLVRIAERLGLPSQR